VYSKSCTLIAGYDIATATSKKAQPTVSKRKKRWMDAVRWSNQQLRMANYRAKVSKIPHTIDSSSSSCDVATSTNSSNISSLTGDVPTNSVTSNQGATNSLIALLHSSSTTNSNSKSSTPIALLCSSVTTRSSKSSKANQPTEKKSSLNARYKEIVECSRHTPQQMNNSSLKRVKQMSKRQQHADMQSKCLTGRSNLCPSCSGCFDIV
jgi:hypothetical protein